MWPVGNSIPGFKDRFVNKLDTSVAALVVVALEVPMVVWPIDIVLA
jgi:hypothetical protein